MPLSTGSRLLLALMLIQPGIAHAVEKTVYTYEDLAVRVKSAFYIVGYCSSLGPECTALQELLEASDAALGGSSSSSTPLRHMLLLHNHPYWSAALNTSSSTQLWFACHNGTHLQLIPLTPRFNATDLPHRGISSSSQRYADDKQHKECDGHNGDGQGVPWYLVPGSSMADRMDLLLTSAAAAAEQYGTACIRGQLLHALAPDTKISTAAKRAAARAGAAAGLAAPHQHLLSSWTAWPPQHLATSASVPALSHVSSVLQRSLNTLLVLLLVFAAGRFWPQLSHLYRTLTTRSAAAAQPPPTAPTPPAPPPVQCPPSSTLRTPQKLTITSPAAPSSLPSAPNTPARGSPDQPCPLPATSPPHLAPHSSLTTAVSLDQLQMDNAQLAELVSQLHSELGGSRAAAADATAAVHRQQAATQEAMCCLQEQLVELEGRLGLMEEFGVAFNAAAAAASAVAQHRSQQQQGGPLEGRLSRYLSCTDSSDSSCLQSPFAMAAASAAQSSAPRTAVASCSTQTTPRAARGTSKVAASQTDQDTGTATQEQQPRSSKPSSTAAAAAAAAAASAAASAAAAAARGGAATEAALQQLCDLMVRQGSFTVAVLEGLTGQVMPSAAAAAAAAGAPKAGVSTADTALMALQLQLSNMRAATRAINTLSDSLKGVRPTSSSGIRSGAAATLDATQARTVLAQGDGGVQGVKAGAVSASKPADGPAGSSAEGDGGWEVVTGYST